METLEANEEEQRRGRLPVLRAGQYRHDILKARLGSIRSLNVRAICKDLEISRETFYATINAKFPVREAIVVGIARKLNFTDEEISQQILKKISL